MTPDLDVLTALLAAATPGHRYANAELAREAVNALPSLIEAARREAGLREALTRIWIMAGGMTDETRIGALQDRLLQIEETARALLHDNAGTAER